MISGGSLIHLTAYYGCQKQFIENRLDKFGLDLATFTYIPLSAILA